MFLSSKQDGTFLLKFLMFSGSPLLDCDALSPRFLLLSLPSVTSLNVSGLISRNETETMIYYAIVCANTP